MMMNKEIDLQKLEQIGNLAAQGYQFHQNPLPDVNGGAQDSIFTLQNPLKIQSLDAPPPPGGGDRRMVGGSTTARALRNAAAGEIVEVQGGGRIMRSTAGRKDRHSKVCTARGPRDRRVRLAAHTAIQFYDVQDRLGFDRPSKAVDWLMKKAHSAIEALNQGSKPPDCGNEVLLPPSMESDSIADTIKSFFPMGDGGGGGGGGGEGSSSAAVSRDVQAIQFESYQSQNLKLSLQSFQEEQIGFDGQSGGWNFSGGGYGGGGGLMFIPPPPPPQPSLHQQQQLLFGGNTGHFFTQGGPLQSNFTHLATSSSSSQDHHHHHQSGFSSFRIPARIQGDGEEDEQDGIPNRPFSLSSGSRH